MYGHVITKLSRMGIVGGIEETNKQKTDGESERGGGG